MMYINVNSKHPPNIIKNLRYSIFHVINYQLMKRSSIKRKTCRIIFFLMVDLKIKFTFTQKMIYQVLEKITVEEKRNMLWTTVTLTLVEYFFLIVF